ncbi:MAG: carboxymuconolactone decarboxylase family protein [Alphaproteobacteria bacterium]|nr:carboxymuconolactone decarboxylase family protein [Alphaproteobacteria bacterium]
MARVPYFDVAKATGKHAEFLGKLKPMLNIYRMLANSEQGSKGFLRMGNALLYRCELDPVLRELAIIRVGRLSRAAYEVFQHERIGREVGVSEEKIAALRDATIEAGVFSDAEKAVLRFTDDVVRNVRASDRTLKPVEALMSRGALVELTLTIGYYMMVSRFLETMGVDGEEGQSEWLKTAKL